ncbi:hypothetical protein RRG08_051244 [Elysia crispata]|uniref:PiggyBac transposable element-derived protein domain-containing protein n=1 Tax=Elysia crispata TaxID=231223 RepID=A0AAE1DMD7_9GAST|nr:hypothetical protein RRG08_051244 [Elysia crispata]
MTIWNEELQSPMPRTGFTIEEEFYSDPAVMLSELEKTNCSDILELMSLEDLYSVMNTSTKGTTVPAKNRSDVIRVILEFTQSVDEFFKRRKINKDLLLKSKARLKMSDESDHISDDSLDDGSTSEESYSDSSDSEQDLDEDEQGNDGDEDDQQFGGGIWATIVGEDPGPGQIPFIGVPGVKVRHVPPRNAPPSAYAKLFFSDTFIDMIVTETNDYAASWIYNHQEYLHRKPHSTVHQWIKEGKTTRQEIQASLAFFFNIGLNKKANIKAYWDVTNSSQATPWFPQHFSRDRVFLLLKFLHFSDSANQPEPNHPDHKLYKIKNLIEHFNRVAQDTFHPYETYSIDESMIGYKGKTPHLRQFMPNKTHARFGVKLWCLCDTLTGYTAFFEVYKGAIDG